MNTTLNLPPVNHRDSSSAPTGAELSVVSSTTGTAGSGVGAAITLSMPQSLEELKVPPMSPEARLQEKLGKPGEVRSCPPKSSPINEW